MSKLTEVLKLLCYDPETDGNLTFNVTEALTKNWEKIDQLVLLAVAAAAAYDPEASYAVGDYCTHGGKLHKCGTPISDGEAWTAEHWTETSVAAELAEVHSLLAPLGGATTAQEALAALGAGVRPNLLDNAYFVGGGSQRGDGHLPINQRGETEYNSYGYTIDRWWMPYHSASLAISSDAITLDGTQNNYRTGLYQLFGNVDKYVGKTMTISAIAKTISGAGFGFGTRTSSVSINQESPTFSNTEFDIVQWTFVPENDFTGVSIFSMQQSKFAVKAIKFEFGNFQTLAYQDASGVWNLLPQPESDYATQLAKCQRFFVNFGLLGEGNYTNIAFALATTSSIANAIISVPVPMRIDKPTVDYSGSLFLSDGSTNIPVTSTAINYTTNGICYFRLNASGLTAGKIYAVRITNGFLNIDANL